jgi:hypothetical protein
VKVALSQGQVTILDGGVERGDKVVVDGADRLRTGAHVTATDVQPRTPAAPASADLNRPSSASRTGSGSSAGSGAAQ